MIALAATSVTVAIMLGVVWRIYKVSFSSAAPVYRMVAEIEAQLRRVPKPPSWMQRRSGVDWGDKVYDAIEFCFWATLGLIGLVIGAVSILWGLSELAAAGPMAIIIALLVGIWINTTGKK